MNAEQLRVNAEIEDRQWWFVGRRRIMRELIERLVPADQDSLIIDVGCGTGGNIGSLSGSYRPLGIDTSRDAVELARQRFPRVRFVQGIAPDDLGPAAGEAKAFLLMDVLEHVRDDFYLLSSLLRSAAVGTYFLITVPANPSLWSAHDESHLHYRRYDPDRLRSVWQGLPVTELGVSYFNSRLYRPVAMLRAINRLRGQASGAAGTDLWMPPASINRLLTNIYGGEAGRLRAVFGGQATRGYRQGVSLIALVRREAGAVERRSKPAELAPDLFDPEAAGLVQKVA